MKWLVSRHTSLQERPEDGTILRKKRLGSTMECGHTRIICGEKLSMVGKE